MIYQSTHSDEKSGRLILRKIRKKHAKWSHPEKNTGKVVPGTICDTIQDNSRKVKHQKT